jgi:hypothetical protein
VLQSHEKHFKFSNGGLPFRSKGVSDKYYQALVLISL